MFLFRKKIEEPQDVIIQKTEVVQAQVEEVKEVMDKNIQDMIERGEKLDDLENKTGKKTIASRKYF